MTFKNRGFSLIELMVAVTIIGILASIVYANFSSGNATTRDAKRQSDLRILQNAITQYKQEYGRYPAMGIDIDSDGFSSEDETNDYIVGHKSGIDFSPKFITRLPKDPKRGTAGAGYSYKTNLNGTVYKLMVSGTVEADFVLNYTHPFKSCDVDRNIAGAPGKLGGWCSNVNGTLSDWCFQSDSRYQKSYAVWGGYEFTMKAEPGDDPFPGQTATAKQNIIAPTVDVICAVPGI